MTARRRGDAVNTVWRRVPSWAQTVRFRLAALHTLVTFLLTATVLGAVYVVVSRTSDAAPLNPVTVAKVRQVDGKLVLRPGEQFQAADLASVQQAVNYQTLETMRAASLWLLPGLLLLSCAVGWWLSGRMLRPIRRVTTTAREIGATDLSRRIALDGPRDELRDLADTLDGMLARLDGAFSAQRQLIDDASHELRHPLAVIRTTLDAVLSRDDVPAAERRHAAGIATRATSRMASLIEDLLASARRAAPAFTETNLDLAAVAAEAADEFALLAGGLRVERRLDAGLTVIGDPAALRRAVDNLLSNARRHAGGTVTVACGRDRGWAFIAVADDGPGLAPEVKERVFDRFYRGEGGGRRHGLGLAIVRQIMESHAGTAVVHSRAGQGATFVLWLPLAPEHRTHRAPAPPSDDPLALPVHR